MSVKHSTRDKIIVSIIATSSVVVSALLVSKIAIPIYPDSFLLIVIVSIIFWLLLMIGIATGFIDFYETWDRGKSE